MTKLEQEIKERRAQFASSLLYPTAEELPLVAVGERIRIRVQKPHLSRTDDGYLQQETITGRVEKHGESPTHGPYISLVVDEGYYTAVPLKDVVPLPPRQRRTPKANKVKVEQDPSAPKPANKQKTNRREYPSECDASIPHDGTPKSYRKGCRGPKCRALWNDYVKELKARRK